MLINPYMFAGSAGVMPVFKAAGAPSGFASSPSVAWPAGTVAGDFALLVVNTRNESISAPAGWTQISASPQGQGTVGGSSGNSGVSIFWKFAAGSDPNVTVTSTYNLIGVILTFTGVKSAAPVNSSAGQNNNLSGTVTYPATITTVTNCLLMQAFTIQQAGGGGIGTPAPPSGDTQIFLHARMAAYTGPTTVPGSYGATTSSITSGYSATSAITLALTPA